MYTEVADKLITLDLPLEVHHTGVVILPQDTHKVVIFHTIIKDMPHQAVEVLVDILVAFEVLMAETV